MTLTDEQAVVLIAVNDCCELAPSGQLRADGTSIPIELRERLQADPNEAVLTNPQIETALADLYELGLIEGVTAWGPKFPVIIRGVTATGRQALP